MRRVLAAAAILIFFAACHDDGIGMEWDANVDPNVSDGKAMEEMTVSIHGGLSPESIAQVVTIDAGRGIETTIEAYKEFDTLVDSCTGTSEMTEEDYEAVKTVVMAADLLNYEPPQENCGIPGQTGIDITYITMSGDENWFDTGFCEIEEEIYDVITVVTDLADQYITDCTVSGMSGIFDDTGGETEPETEGTDVDDDEVEPGTVPETDASSDGDEVGKMYFRPITQVE